jgi:hypothetical protein
MCSREAGHSSPDIVDGLGDARGCGLGGLMVNLQPV